MDGLAARLQLPKLAELCRRYGVTRLSVFGSALRDDFTEESDFDFVVDFVPSDTYRASAQFFGFEEALATLYGRKGIKNPYFKQSLEEQEVPIFAA